MTTKRNDPVYYILIDGRGLTLNQIANTINISCEEDESILLNEIGTMKVDVRSSEVAVHSYLFSMEAMCYSDFNLAIFLISNRLSFVPQHEKNI